MYNTMINAKSAPALGITQREITTAEHVTAKTTSFIMSTNQCTMEVIA